MPDYAQFLSFMREIGYDGYFTYELCHPFLNDRHELRGLADVDEQASLAREFFSGLLAQAGRTGSKKST